MYIVDFDLIIINTFLSCRIFAIIYFQINFTINKNSIINSKKFLKKQLSLVLNSIIIFKYVFYISQSSMEAEFK